MIIYTPLPIEQVLEGNSDFSPDYKEIEKDGCILLIEPISFSEGRIVRLISSNPQEYLKPTLQPGEIIKLM